MTLTPPVVDAARGRVVLITGADKAARRRRRGSRAAPPPDELPIARVRRTDTVVVLDPAAAAGLSTTGAG